MLEKYSIIFIKVTITNKKQFNFYDLILIINTKILYLPCLNLLWCASFTITINCDVLVVQIWSTVMCQLYNNDLLWCFQLYNYDQLWCASCTIMIYCDVPVVQLCTLWCARCIIMINCDVHVVQLWSTVICQLYRWNLLWCVIEFLQKYIIIIPWSFRPFCF